MKSMANTPDEYIKQLPDDRKTAIIHLRAEILKSIPKGFSEVIDYGMLCYVVPHSLYPSGYRADPKHPLPFMALASQKNYISFYNMAIYSNEDLLEWFTSEYARQCKHKLDKGKGCIRFKKLDDIPYKLIGELAGKITPKEWIKIYETNLSQNRTVE